MYRIRLHKFRLHSFRRRGARQRSVLAGFLILLLLSNSSMALENAIHQSHEHIDTLTAAMSMLGAETQLHSGSMDSLQSVAVDCLCDDICCVSSPQFVSAPASAIDPGIGNDDFNADDLYQSIALDLLLPPPNA